MRPHRTGRLRRLVRLGVLALVLDPAPGLGQSAADRRLQQRRDEANRREAEAVVELVERAMAGRRVASDFRMEWRHDFLKASPGTFVPFTITLDPAALTARHALMYVRVVRRGSPSSTPASQEGRGEARFAFDAIFPVDLGSEPAQSMRVTRGFAVPPGDYQVLVAVRERPADPLDPAPRELKAGVLSTDLRVPDFWTGELTTSTIMLADRIEVLPQPIPADQAFERPYVIGQNDVHVAAGRTFRRDRELIVVFVIYNPALTDSRHFDLQVDYHVFQRGPGGDGGAPGGPPARPGERYVTRTNPQRLNRAQLGSAVDPAAGHPVLAGQGILLSAFEEGEYRLGITVTDLVSRTTVTRDVTFRVAGS